jgi:hypothetical protein
MERFALSPAARELIATAFPNSATLDDAFTFDSEEFARHTAFTSLEFNTGAILTALSGRFDDVFKMELVDEDRQEYKVSTSGRVIDRRVRKRAP